MKRTNWSAHGIEVVHALVEYTDHTEHHGKASDDLVRLHVGLRGDYRVSYPQIGAAFDLVGGHHNVLYAPNFEMTFVNKTMLIETFGVRFPVAQFIAYTDGTNDALSRFCERLARKQPSMLFDTWAGLTPAIEITIRQIIETDFTGRLLEMFVLSKSIELLALSIEASLDSQVGHYVRTTADRERIIAARELVNDRLRDPPTLSEVARAVGLNEFKLKRGFKEVFGTTVFAYLTEQRLELAKRYLLDTDRTAAEIAFELGYATPQHFSAAFKKHFGVTPNSIRKTP